MKRRQHRGSVATVAVKKSLGDVFSQQTFSADERARIGKLLGDGGIAANIIKNYVVRTAAYRDGFRKREKIPGFRNGNRLYDKHAIPLIIRCLEDPADRRHIACWDSLYRAAAIEFIGEELAKLNRLLAEVSPPRDESDAAALVRSICINAMDFDVSQADVCKFYELWGTPRVAGFEELLPLCLQRDEEGARRRAQQMFESKLEALEAAAAANASQIQAQAQSSSELHQVLETCRAQTRAAVVEVQATSKELNELRLTIFPGLEKRVADLDETVRRLIVRTRQGESKAAESANKIQKLAADIKSLVVATVATLGTDLREAIGVEMLTATQGLEARLHALVPAATPAEAVDQETHDFDWLLADQVVRDRLGLRAAISGAFKARGVAPASGMRIHAALAAGLFPILVGPNALSALDAYSQVACGARGVTVHVTPAMIEPAELFGRLDTVSGRFVRHAAGLVDLVRAAARAPSSVALAILEGANRGPTESYLLPLLQMRARGGRIPLFHPGTAVGGPALEPIVNWPPNLWLAATLVDGPTSLPLSRDLLAFGVVIEVESCEQVVAGAPAASSEIDMGSEIGTPADIQSDVVNELIAALPDAGGCRATLSRFGAMLARFESDPERLRTALLEAVLVPFVATLESDDERQQAGDTLLEGLGAEELARLTMLGRRLHRRLA